MELIFLAHYLIQFYCDRLKERALIIPHVIAGLHVLVSLYMSWLQC